LKWIRDLSFYEYDGDNCPVIQGSALGGLNNDQLGYQNELMEAVDAWIEEPISDTEKPFLMPVEMYLQLLVVELLLQVVSKQVLLIQEIQLKSLVWAEKLTSTITGVEMFRKILDRGEAGIT
jgi:elongation factor Tu